MKRIQDSLPELNARCSRKCRKNCLIKPTPWRRFWAWLKARAARRAAIREQEKAWKAAQAIYGKRKGKRP